MTEKATFRFSAQAAAFLGKDVPREKRLEGARGPAGLAPLERVQLLVYLGNDADQEVKATAVQSLRTLDPRDVRVLLANENLHPRILDVLVKYHFSRTELLPLFLDHPALSGAAAAFLAGKVADAAPPLAVEPGENVSQDVAQEVLADAADDGGEEETSAGAVSGEEEEIDEEEYQSKFQMAQTMGVGDKIKMAMTGDKEWRTLLIKDTNKLVSGAVIKNPRLTENEVLGIAKSAVQNDDIMRMICANKEWVKNYQIRKALVENHKTPLPAALRYVATLSEKDLSLLAKSKNVSSVIAAQARRLLMAKSHGR